jgi:hypothetical protein
VRSTNNETAVAGNRCSSFGDWVVILMGFKKGELKAHLFRY